MVQGDDRLPSRRPYLSSVISSFSLQVHFTSNLSDHVTSTTELYYLWPITMSLAYLHSHNLPTRH